VLTLPVDETGNIPDASKVQVYEAQKTDTGDVDITLPDVSGNGHAVAIVQPSQNHGTLIINGPETIEKNKTGAHYPVTYTVTYDKEATATTRGSKHEECTVCGYKKAAVEIPATGSAVKPTDQTDNFGNTTPPKTDDSSNLVLWIALLLISGGAVIGTTVVIRKKKHNR